MEKDSGHAGVGRVFFISRRRLTTKEDTGKKPAERMWGEILPFVQAAMAEVDPEFSDITIEDIFNGMYGREQHLELQTRELCTITMLTALGKPEELDVHFMVAFNLGWTYEELRELLLLCVIPAGWPCAIDALRKLQQWCKDNNRDMTPGIELREGYHETDWFQKGNACGEELFGFDSWQRLLSDLDVLGPDLKEFFVSVFYGKLMTRENLDSRTGKLCMVAAFAVRKEAFYLGLQIQAALQSGVSEQALKEILFQVGIYAGHEAIAHAVSVWKQIR